MDYARSRYRHFQRAQANRAIHADQVGQTVGDWFNAIIYGIPNKPRKPFPDPTPIEQTPFGEQQPVGPSLEELLIRARVPGQGTVVTFPRPSPLGPPPRGDGGGLIRPPIAETTPVPPPIPEGPSTLRSVGEFLLLTAPAWGAYLYTRLYPGNVKR